MASMLEISGESGGGQLLRSALSLSMITGQAFRMTNIRGKRPKPGLMRQHLTCVKAAATICAATIEGAELGSTELSFMPDKISGGDYAFAIGTGGSTTLVLQTLLPALLHASSPSTLQIEGGTHNPMAPPFEFIEQCFLPLIRSMGAEVNVTLERHGFMQAGGGALSCRIEPLAKWIPLNLTQRGELLGTFGLILHAHLDKDIVRRETARASHILEWAPEHIEVRYANESTGPGNAILLGARFANVCEISTGIAQMGKSAESVATGAAKGLRGYLASTTPVGVLLADQLLLPMALSGGGQIHTLSISEHSRTNIALIERFLPVRFETSEEGPGIRAIRLIGNAK